MSKYPSTGGPPVQISQSPHEFYGLVDGRLPTDALDEFGWRKGSGRSRMAHEECEETGHWVGPRLRPLTPEEEADHKTACQLTKISGPERKADMKDRVTGILIIAGSLLSLVWMAYLIVEAPR